MTGCSAAAYDLGSPQRSISARLRACVAALAAGTSSSIHTPRLQRILRCYHPAHHNPPPLLRAPLLLYPLLPPPPASDDAHDWSSTYHRSHVSLNLPQRVFLASSSALLSLLDTHRADLVAAFIESTSASALPTLLSRLRSSPSGARLLALKPRITPHSIAHLSLLPPHTLGGAYHAFLSSHAYSPASRPLTRWVDGEDAAWVVQRYREVHDVWHTVTACDVSVVGELAQKVFEWRQTGLPGLLAAGLGGGLRVGRVERGTWAEGVSWGWRAGGNSEFLLGVHWEELWEEDLNDLRQRLHIEVAPPALRAPQ